MTTAAIAALDVESISADDAVLYLWSTPHMDEEAREVMRAWGFAYRTQIIWRKPKIGLGEWTRNQHELLLIGRKGAFPPPAPANRPPSVIDAPVTEHSRKPDIFAEMIERCYPDQPKIELFRRVPARPGWSAWGNEVKAA